MIGGINQHERVAGRKCGIAGRANARCRLAERRPGPDPHRVVGVAAHRDETTEAQRIGHVHRRRHAQQVGIADVTEAQGFAVHRDAVSATIQGRGKAKRRGKRDQLVNIAVRIENAGVEAVGAIDFDPDPANHGAIAVQGKAPGSADMPSGERCGPGDAATP